MPMMPWPMWSWHSEMELVWLQDFVALVQEGSFSRAAEARNVTQPAFSRRIRSLEDWVGEPLFNRTAQGVTLTTAGEAFEASAEDLLRQILGLRARAREAGGRATRTLQFAATQTLSFTFFPGWIRFLGERLELGPIQLNTGNMATCEQIMLHGGAQFLLCHHHASIADPFGGRFPSMMVGSDRLIAVSGADHDGRPLFRAIPGGPPVAYLAYSTESGLGRIVRSCEPALIPGVSRNVVFNSHLAAALLSVARDGGGMAWLPHSLAETDLQAGRLVRAAGEECDISIEIRLFRPESPLSKAAETFWDLLVKSSAPTDATAPGVR